MARLAAAGLLILLLPLAAAPALAARAPAREAAPAATTTSAQPATTSTPREIHSMPKTQRATGTFEVQMKPLAGAEGSAVGRMSLDKTFTGDLQATGKGEMLAYGTATEGSAAYVAAEVVTGALKGRTGSFALVHRGIMDRGTGDLSVVVVPDSGTGELQGLVGTLDIRIEGGKHYYDLDYSLPAN